MKKRLLIWVCMLLATMSQLKAQTGGRFVYNFLKFNYSSRIMALGSNLVSVHDDDPALILVNPSYISERHHNNLSLNFTDYFTKSTAIAATYSYTFPKAGSFAFGIYGLNYGSFRGADENGNETGNFSAGDYALVIGWGRELSPNFSIGANLKTIFSFYESYFSTGLAVDVAGSYYNENKKLSLTLLAKNIGGQLKPYSPGDREMLPFDLQFALSQRLQHVPIRYHITLHSLYRWKMNYYGIDNPFIQIDAISGEPQYPSKVAQFADNLFRHFVFGLEIEPSKYFSIQLAYNHNIHQEMKVLSRKSMAGFSYGIQLNIRGIRVGFSRQHYAVGATPNCFDLAFDFDELSNLHKERKNRKLERITP
ncbi:MAG: type IX secretion system protein PorQ [Bacteroidales bacterium]|nr:type IX secretion system protein PorQ [Bacteroidales bacterium]MDD6184971.1 type IX secretion system protein PorQ [Bacteroidales bacterium]